MTVSYAGEVPNGSSFGCFWKILLKWRGSVYKLVWRELLAYLAVYYTINVVYRYVLQDDQKRGFEKVRQYFGAQGESIPMSFVLGFYVTLIVNRWWDQYKTLPWPDTLALFISAAIPGNNETGRLMRRNIMRYSVLAYVITLMRISLRVKKRFPTWQHLVDAGLMLESEKKIFEIMDGKSPMSKYWMPLVWATNIINRARKQEIIASDHIVQTLLVELSDIRRKLGALIGYDTVCVPLVYTQVVTLVVYSYFITALLGRQMIPRENGIPLTGKYEDPDIYFPLFTALQFCFYVGWLKVAEVLINPFGEDDDDIELNWLIDRHIKASYMIVDEMHEEHPELLKDQYWEEVVPTELPYTVASEHYRRFEPKGSAEDYKIKEADAMYANIIPSKRSHLEDMYAFADYESVDAPMAEGDDDDENSTPMRNRKNRRKESVRSSSSMYSSNNILKWYRRNSAYSNPDNETAPKPRRSSRNLMHMMKRDNFNKGSKTSLNGSIKISGPLKNRPRIPTPDVSNAPDKKNRFHFTPVAISSGTISPLNKPTSTNSVVNVAGMTLISSQLSSSNGTPVTLLLSPIKESDSNSAHSTLHAGSPTTNALASAVLPQLHANADRKNVISSDLNVSINRPQYIASNFPTIPDFQATSLMNEITTELNDGKKSGDELERKNNELESHAVNGNPSLTSNLTIPLNRQLSIESKLSDSPSLPKRDQLTTSSAPSAHTKSNSIKDEKNEVFV